MVQDGGHFIGWVPMYWNILRPQDLVMVGTAYQRIGLGKLSRDCRRRCLGRAQALRQPRRPHGGRDPAVGHERPVSSGIYHSCSADGETETG